MDASKLYRIAIAAKKTGVGRTTIIEAIRRGELTAYTTACELPLVTLSDVRAWAKNPPKVGRPPKC